LAHYAQSIPRENFTCLTRLDHNRAKAQIASRLKVSPDAVKNLTIWGNHSSTQFPDVRSATVTINGKETPVYEAVKDDNWLKNDFVSVRKII
jgi:malate dehydrogenase